MEWPNRESAPATSIDYCLVCAFEHVIDIVCQFAKKPIPIPIVNAPLE